MKLYFVNSALELQNLYFNVMYGYSRERKWNVLFLITWEKVLQITGHLAGPSGSS